MSVKKAKDKRLEVFEKYKRDELGLLVGTEYKFNDDGKIDWRSMVKPDYLYPNKKWFESRERSVPESIDGLKDNQLLIRLYGLVELAQLRGFNNIISTITESGPERAVANCSIGWIPNYETSGVAMTVSKSANATTDNVGEFMRKFLETQAENRAFGRAIRNFLGIDICTVEEIDSSTKLSVSGKFEASGPVGALMKRVGLKASEFEAFKPTLRTLWKDDLYRNADSGNWKNWSDINPSVATDIIAALGELKNK
jgi:hypothetical protein